MDLLMCSETGAASIEVAEDEGLQNISIENKKASMLCG
jgi:hypothetical protein